MTKFVMGSDISSMNNEGHVSIFYSVFIFTNDNLQKHQAAENKLSAISNLFGIYKHNVNAFSTKHGGFDRRRKS